MSFFNLLSLLLFAFHWASAQSIPAKVGLRNLDLVDSSRSNWLGNGLRPLRCAAWYPGGEGGSKEVLVDHKFFSSPIEVFRNAGVDSKEKSYPLVVISHGSQSKGEDMKWLAHYLASKGFIAVAIDHNGTDIEELRREKGLTLSDFCMWERPRDISVLIDNLLRDSFLSSRIDRSKIAVAGFSLGGTTAIWAAGAVFDMDRLRKHEAPTTSRYQEDIKRFSAYIEQDPVGIRSLKQANATFKDTRIKAVFALAPAVGQGFDKKGLENITVPVQIVVGKDDRINPMDLNAAYYTKNIRTARTLIVLSGERGHYTKPAIGDERAAELKEVADLAYRFFKDVFDVNIR